MLGRISFTIELDFLKILSNDELRGTLHPITEARTSKDYFIVQNIIVEILKKKKRTVECFQNVGGNGHVYRIDRCNT